jgi:hypothetical protein
MATNAIVSATDHNLERALCWGAFVVFSALIVIFLRHRSVHRWTQIGVSVLAFWAWAAASPGPFQLIHGWKEVFGTLALIGAVAVLIAWNAQPLPDAVLGEQVSGN